MRKEHIICSTVGASFSILRLGSTPLTTMAYQIPSSGQTLNSYSLSLQKHAKHNHHYLLMWRVVSGGSALVIVERGKRT
uniref:Putative ovule protein n=1 Tax=Solanum chacoense TaxID=4108 RepID=A0A0V0GWG9_SOLCH